MIYRTMAFGHQKCFRDTGYISGHGRGSGHPRQKIWALWAKRGNTPATKGLVRPPYRLAKLEKESGRRKGKRE